MSTAHRTEISLARLARALGGETYAGGRRALAPAPGHGPADRSVSLLLAHGRLVVHSFGAADWREVLDLLRAQGWIDAENRLCDTGGGGDVARRPDPTRAERVRAAAALWAAAGPIRPMGPAALYGQARGVDFGLDVSGALRTHPATPVAIYRNGGSRLPALLAAVRAPGGDVTAVEVTYLDGRGRRSRLARPARKVVGVIPAGSAVRFTPAAEAMLVAEGVFTTLAAMSIFGLPGWALLSTTNLRRWRAPPEVRRVLIAADRGADGERSAAVLRNGLASAGLAAAVALPPLGAGDWADVLQAEGGREGRIGAPGPEGRSRPAGREPSDAQVPRS